MKRTLVFLFTLTISTVWLLEAQEKTANSPKLPSRRETGQRPRTTTKNWWRCVAAAQGTGES